MSRFFSLNVLPTTSSSIYRTQFSSSFSFLSSPPVGFFNSSKAVSAITAKRQESTLDAGQVSVFHRQFSIFSRGRGIFNFKRTLKQESNQINNSLTNIDPAAPRSLSVLDGDKKTEYFKNLENEPVNEPDSKAERVNERLKSGFWTPTNSVRLAILSNVTVTVSKLFGAFFTGSGVLFAEGVHSLADTANQCLLAFGIARSKAKPDQAHPYGYAREQFIWALISATGVFFVGGCVSVYHGIQSILDPHEVASLPVAFSILGFCFVAEALTLGFAIKTIHENAKFIGMPFKDYVVRGPDPMAVAVMLEDGAAVLGVGIASVCLGLTAYTGNVWYDAAGSILIGSLLGAVASFLVRRNSDALVGRSIEPERLAEIIMILEADPIVRAVHNPIAITMGNDQVTFKAEIHFDGRAVSKRYISQNIDIIFNTETFAKHGTLEPELLDYGDAVVQSLGDEIDRLEEEIRNYAPEIKYVDLEVH